MSMDALFSPGDLGEMRAMNDASLPHEATITTLARVRGAGGAITESRTSTAPVPCRLSASSPAQGAAMSADELQSSSRWTVVFPAGTLAPIDAILHVTGELDDGTPWAKDLKVVAVHGPKTYEVLRKVTCADLTAGGR